jgi:hypothetical protein
MIYPSSVALRVPAQLRPRPIALEVPRLTTTRDELVNVTFAVAAVIVVTFVVGDIGLLGSLVGFGFAGLIVLPVSNLGHELGHALAVSRLGRRNSMVIVGRGPFLRFTAGRAVVLFSILPTRGVPFAGVCRYDPSGVPWRAIGWIALAGPLATAAELVGLVTAGPLLWTIGSLARFVLVLSAEVLIWTLVQSLRGHTSATPAGGSGRLLHDGDLARLAFARHQAGIPPAAPSTAIR